jgi:hypothetical protein
MVPVTLRYSVSDNCDASPKPVITISSNEPVDGTGDGDTSPDWELIGAHLGAGKGLTASDCYPPFENCVFSPENGAQAAKSALKTKELDHLSASFRENRESAKRADLH